MPQADLAAAQYRFAGAIRDPGNCPPPAGVSRERLSVYHELFFNNFRSSLESAYPVLHDVLEPGLWQRLIERFFREHRCTTPEFPRMPQEFLRWLEQRQSPEADEPAFVPELALWEWTELEVLLEPETAPADRLQGYDPLTCPPVLTSTLRLRSFRYPVHRIMRDFLPDAPLDEPVHLAAYRDPDDEVAFLALSPVSAALLQCLTAEPGLSAQLHIERLAKRMQYPDPDKLHRFAADFLADLYDKGVVLGAIPANNNGEPYHVVTTE